MASSLGIFIDHKVVKYVKLNKIKDKVKVEAYGIKYGENKREIVSSIIRETNSERIPIVVNASEVNYEETSIFAILKKKDYEKAVEIEYEAILEQRKLIKELYEYGYILSENKGDTEKLNVLIAMQDKNSIETRVKIFPDNVNVRAIMPVDISISNLYQGETAALIVNLEEDTYITEILEGVAVKTTKSESGISHIISEVDKTENSLPKSYEVVRNIVLPVNDMDQMTFEGNEYAPVVTAEILNVCEDIKRVISRNFGLYKKIYITGTGSCISNIDVFIEKVIGNVECELLKPEMLEEGENLPIKEYIDVNSAFALALEEQGYERQYMSFKREQKNGINLGSLNSIDTSGLKVIERFKGKLKTKEIFGIRVGIASLFIMIIFALFAQYIVSGNIAKQNEVEKNISAQRQEISKIEEDGKRIAEKRQDYESLITRIDKKMDTAEGDRLGVTEKNSIPDLLTNIAHIIPKRVKITSIVEKNNKITIKAEAYEYEQLGFFIGKINTEKILNNVKTSKDQKSKGILEITIEGDLV